MEIVLVSSTRYLEHFDHDFRSWVKVEVLLLQDHWLYSAIRILCEI